MLLYAQVAKYQHLTCSQIANAHSQHLKLMKMAFEWGQLRFCKAHNNKKTPIVAKKLEFKTYEI